MTLGEELVESANAHASVQVMQEELVTRILIRVTEIPAKNGKHITLPHRHLVELIHCRIVKFCVYHATKTQKATADFNPT
jgi:hypothetical protein